MNLGRGDFESVLDAQCTCRICGNGEVSRIRMKGITKKGIINEYNSY